mmetsp:Transcript_17490/g.34818  ORF Transcript_17490/g.34818 Transcript_17490/m.34818 type:complete len:130 (+) Transcript_17490:198-587(+)|eukprot:CAMPEP_0194329108 /NCGR_PEP_ID=MMETSP0171-20130528/47042_1 /TAXON_ID=218684 /ORGANISM="Corethron pennatum, Strain L29A3" /LENGTH=129 /DNA_ID=CAMNT_0039089711 /DNA_START=109 /DNA_END=498 /DNA_ORIENTATION=-
MVYNEYPVLRFRYYDESCGDYGWDYELQEEFTDIQAKADAEGKPILYNGKPRYSMDLHHDFCYISDDDGGNGEWVVANLWRDPEKASCVSNCGPDDESQDMHGDFPPAGRWSQYNRFRDARWHLEMIWT